ncbi:MAG: ATP-binding protein [Clostridiales bacterium]|jgi:DNA replication protein DnaC|nr:ATP-binding protein [Clostridiales bacterium]
MDKTDMINQILRDYQKNRHFAELKRQADYELALSDAEFRALQERYGALVLAAAREDSNAALKVGGETKGQIDGVRQRQAERLKELNIDDFFDETRIFACRECKDTGYSDGKLCRCVETEIAKRLKQKAAKTAPPQIAATFLTCDAKIFDESIRPAIEKIYSSMKNYAESFPPKKIFNIFITGATGTGKTFLTSCVYNAVSEKSFYAEYLTAFNVNNLFLKCHLSPMEEKYAIMNDLVSCDLLIIDDLGAEPMLNNVTKEYFFNLFNERLNARKSTIISTNLSPADILSRYGERIFSRICPTIINIPGSDLRTGKANA